jgi:GDP/UDP-N,N'-diacetylbacillosamine 2-epimerase (hydrolysing)
MPRRICVLTGTRAEYGLLRWLAQEIEDDPALELQLLVTGAHLSHEFGETYREIEDDGFTIAEKVDMLLASDSPTALARSVALGVIGIADALRRLAPDVLVLLGDRYEVLAAAQAAMLARIPIAHLHGGEATEGLIDEAIRHAVTKMSHLHFVAAEDYRRRVIQLGEHPDRVYDVGALGLDGIVRAETMTLDQLAEDLDLRLDQRPLVLCTYHPVTLADDLGVGDLDQLLAALDDLEEATVVFTRANADEGGRAVNARIDGFVRAAPQRRVAVSSLGQRRYLSLLREADVVVGNSSSGLLEAPTVRTATVNVGDRQRGRLRAPSVVDVAPTREAILEGLHTALSADFRERAVTGASPFGTGGASPAIVEVLRTVPLAGLVDKTFHDVRWQP